MYSELLSVICVDGDTIVLPESEEELVVILLHRRRTEGRSSTLGPVNAEDLALELDHDRMLLRLCSAMGIDHDPHRFVNPLPERQRLENALRLCGIDFRTLDEGCRAGV